MVVVIVREQQDVDRRQERRRQPGPGDPLRPEPGHGRGALGQERVGQDRSARRAGSESWHGRARSRHRHRVPPRCRPGRPRSAARGRRGPPAPARPGPAGATGTSASPPRSRHARGCPAGCGRCRRAGGAKGACRCPGLRRGIGATRTARPRAAPTGGGVRCQLRRASPGPSCNRRWCSCTAGPAPAVPPLAFALKASCDCVSSSAQTGPTVVSLGRPRCQSASDSIY